MSCWLMKSEPTVYSIADLERNGSTCWEGVRNFQARNFMRDAMKIGDKVLFYHSNADPAGVVGVARVVRAGYPDSAAFDKKSRYYDERSTASKPLWFMVDIEFVAKFSQVVTLEQMKNDPELEGIMVARRGMRLSIQPVSQQHFDRILALGARL